MRRTITRPIGTLNRNFVNASREAEGMRRMTFSTRQGSKQWKDSLQPHAFWLAACVVVGLVTTSIRGADDATKLEPIALGQPARIEVFPPQFSLKGPRSQMHLIVTAVYADGAIQDVTRIAEFSSAKPDVIEVEHGIARPRADGAAEIHVKVGTLETAATAQVVDQTIPQPRSFEFDTLAALSKQGCNAGACHGSPSGKGAFASRCGPSIRS